MKFWYEFFLIVFSIVVGTIIVGIGLWAAGCVGLRMFQ